MITVTNKVDIKENYIKDLDEKLLALLLLDQTTKKNLIWATDNYNSKGYYSNHNISISAISGRHGSIIKPRTEKSKDEIQQRIRNKAEVFTPSWICNAQNNLIDDAWFGRKNVFNFEGEKTWVRNNDRILFPLEKGKSWQDYVKSTRLEITCGEAPYIVSRYDTVSGNVIPLSDRIGILDRKIRVINENTTTQEEWLEWVIWAFKSVYAFDWQGDNVLLARENILFTFIDYFVDRYSQVPSIELLMEIATIISWNVWQMDGIKFVIPNSCTKKEESFYQYNLFGEKIEPLVKECEGCAKNKFRKHNGIYCKVMDWKTKRANKFVNLVGKGL